MKYRAISANFILNNDICKTGNEGTDFQVIDKYVNYLLCFLLTAISLTTLS